MLVGAVFDEVARSIPVHNATRFWAATRGQRKAAPPLVTQRWALFLHALRALDVTFEPRMGHGNPTRFDATVTAQTRPCPACGTPFFGYRSRTGGGCGCTRGRRH